MCKDLAEKNVESTGRSANRPRVRTPRLASGSVSASSSSTVVGNGARNGGESLKGVDIGILVVLALLMLRTYLRRAESEPPKWMGRLQSANAGFSFKLGFLLLGVFPTDIATSIAMGAYAGNHSDSWFQCLPFIVLTLLFLATPSLLLLILGSRAHALLPKVRDWMTDNSWVVNEIVLAFFVAITLNSLLG